MEKHSQKKRIICLIAGATALLFSGIIYAWSILKGPLAEEFGWSDTALALNYTLTFCFFGIGGILGSILTRKIASRATLLTAAICVCAGFSGTFFMDGRIWMLYLCYGLLGGLGIGMAYTTIVTTVNSWFPDRKGLASGVIMLCFGGSSLVFGRPISMLMKPSAAGWRNTYLLCGVAISASLLLGACLIGLPGEEDEVPATKKQLMQSETFPGMELSPRKMMCRLSFWQFYLFCVLITAVGGAVISMASDITMSFGASEDIAVVMVGLLSVCNGAGRLFSGVTYDFFGRRCNTAITCVCSVLASILMIIGLAGNAIWVGLLGLCLTGFSYGGIPPAVPPFISQFYGKQYFSTNYSIGNTIMIPASFGATLASLLLQYSGSYIVVLAAAATSSAIALTLVLSIKKP